MEGGVDPWREGHGHETPQLMSCMHGWASQVGTGIRREHNLNLESSKSLR